MRPASRPQTGRHSLASLAAAPSKTEGAVSHPFLLGDIVAILAIGSSGRPFIEGRARIKATGQQSHFYRVVFLGEKFSRRRFVNPDWQSDPERSLALLLEFWRANASPPSLDEFFPTISAEEES